jgi:hypothetical protein
MMSIGKRAAGIAAALAMIAGAGPVALAGASTARDAAPGAAASPFAGLSGPYRAGADAAIGGLNAGADGAVFGWNAGLAVFGLPFQFKAFPGGPLGLHTVGLAPLDQNR